MRTADAQLTLLGLERLALLVQAAALAQQARALKVKLLLWTLSQHTHTTARTIAAAMRCSSMSRGRMLAAASAG